MMDDNDDGARVGLWVVIGIITLLLFGLIGGLAMRSMAAKKAQLPVPAASTAAAPAASADMLIDAPLSGELVAKMYFALGQADLPADASSVLAPALKALAENPAKKLVLAGFHDPSGNAVVNADLAKSRAKAVRAALSAQGVAADRLVLRKPEQTTTDGPADEARRVEVRLVD